MVDTDFDKMVHRYDALAKKLGLEPTASDMVDFDWRRPSCMRAAFAVHKIDPHKAEYRLHADGSVYKRNKKGMLTKIKTKC